MSEPHATERPRWRRFAGPYHLVIVLLVGGYVALPVIGHSDLGGMIVVGVYVVALLLGIGASGARPRNLKLAWVLAGLMGLAVVAEFAQENLGERMIRPISALLSPSFFTVALAPSAT